MKFKDDETISIASTVKDVLEGKAVKKEEEGEPKYPHMMYDPKTGKGVEAKDKEEHEALAKKGYTHEKPKLDEVEEPRAKGEKDFKAKHPIKKSGEKEDGTVVKESEKEDDDEEEVEEESPKQAKYKKVFNAALKKFGVKSPAELKGDKKKEFFDYVDKNYDAGENEED